MLTKDEYEKLQRSAQQKCRTAIKEGKIPKLSARSKCACGNKATMYDHRDYRKPFEIEPVCRSCNRKRPPAKPEFEKEKSWRGWTNTGCDGDEVNFAFAGECHALIDEDIIDNHADFYCLETDKDLIAGLDELEKFPVKKKTKNKRSGYIAEWPWWLKRKS